MTGSSGSNRSESQGRTREGLSTKEGRSNGNDRRNTNRQRGRVRAMSVLGNAKSKLHRKTHQVEPDGTDPKRMFMHLTRGDLLRESAGEASRGRSSEDARRKAGGAKGRRTNERATEAGLRHRRQEGIRNARGAATTAATPSGEHWGDGWIPVEKVGAEAKSEGARKEEARKCSMK